MASIPQIRTRLLEGFPEKQADLIAHVVIEAHDDLVNRADFHELTCVVKDIAAAQERLVERQDRLVERQDRLVEVQEQLVERQDRLTEVQEQLVERQDRLTEAQDRLVERQDRLTEAQDRLVERQDRLTEAQDRLVERQDRLTEVQEQLVERQDRLTEAQDRLTEAQHRTEGTLSEVVKTQLKMLTRLDRLDGHMLEDKVARNLPAFLGREFRKCRVLERAEFLEGLEAVLPEDELADLMRADTIATATRAGESLHIVVETSCTADAEDLDRAVRRSAALARAGFRAIGIVACEVISPQTLAEARRRGLRVLAGGWLLPDAA